MKKYFLKLSMKLIFSLTAAFLVILIFSCGTKLDKFPNNQKNDSIYIKKIDSIQTVNKKLSNDILFLYDSVKITSKKLEVSNQLNILLQDSIKNHKCKQYVTFEAAQNQAALTKIMYYIKICDNRPQNGVFLKGWTKRALRKVPWIK